ncbi:MAG: hypothetical protein A2X86_19645 [Bdellovibrionales bacterium GWA2_49_15]|nr:MAG: hypothetical protein A2X86_19645 [Bdellovibrionales bacterium GWA2_49_15]HAZ13794.1 hypothetical protein [Bdellovibrionales bacterium]
MPTKLEIAGRIIDEIIKPALNKIPHNKLFINVDLNTDSNGAIWKSIERVNCYEFYHQCMVKLGKLKRGKKSGYWKNIEIFGEVNKGSYGYLGTSKIPDLIFHQIGERNNFVVVEIKTSRNTKGIKKDWNTFHEFCASCDSLKYKRAVYIIFGESLKVKKFDLREKYPSLRGKMRIFHHGKAGECLDIAQYR